MDYDNTELSDFFLEFAIRGRDWRPTPGGNPEMWIGMAGGFIGEALRLGALNEDEAFSIMTTCRAALERLEAKPPPAAPDALPAEM